MADNTPEALEAEIERTRAELARSIDLIAERLSPKNAAQRSVVKAREEAGKIAEDVGSIVRREQQDRTRSPLTGPMLLGGGLALTVAALRLLLVARRRRP